eukprot:scaffold1724_cov246-Pinguiococcus_pyrenoidosus.AAC.6
MKGKRNIATSRLTFGTASSQPSELHCATADHVRMFQAIFALALLAAPAAAFRAPARQMRGRGRIRYGRRTCGTDDCFGGHGELQRGCCGVGDKLAALYACLRGFLPSRRKKILLDAAVQGSSRSVCSRSRATPPRPPDCQCAEGWEMSPYGGRRPRKRHCDARTDVSRRKMRAARAWWRVRDLLQWSCR